VVQDRDVAAFDDRARGYEDGVLGRLHHEIADRAVDLCLVGVPAPRRILDVGCGTGYLLRQLAARVPTATRLVGVDAAPSMISVAEAAATDARVRFSAGTAEHLPHPDAGFDLVVTTTSFDHWANQQAGLGECARVLKPGGRLVLADLFSAWLLPTLLLGRAGKARTPRAATHLLTTAGFRSIEWHDLYALIIRAATATKSRRS
jgi:ubiquinone/menaquinone biosynthesis C-methylase UbiE